MLRSNDQPQLSSKATGSEATEVSYGCIWDIGRPINKPTKHRMPVVDAEDGTHSAMGRSFHDGQISYQLHASFQQPFLANVAQPFHITVQPDDLPNGEYKLKFEYGIDGKYISGRVIKTRTIVYQQSVYGFSTPTTIEEPEFNNEFRTTVLGSYTTI